METIGEAGDVAEIDDEAVPLCVCCLGELNHDQVVFCPHCFAPIDPLADMVPFYHVFAGGWILRRAIERAREHQKPIPIGLVLLSILFPPLWLAVFAVLWKRSKKHNRSVSAADRES
ncbi:MAG: hypothetical protein KDM91_07310 [Verrucomicrobiae bacterium]|nr:hypothetical protein [Verrucomicrobiae bacterium]